MRGVSGSDTGSNFSSFLRCPDREKRRELESIELLRRFKQPFLSENQRSIFEDRKFFSENWKGSRYGATVVSLIETVNVPIKGGEVDGHVFTDGGGCVGWKLKDAVDRGKFQEVLRELDSQKSATIRKICHSDLLLPQEKQMILDSEFIEKSIEMIREAEEDKRGASVHYFQDELMRRFLELVERCWKNNKPGDEDISQFWEAVKSLKKRGDERTELEVIMQQAGTLSENSDDVKLLRFFLQYTQEKEEPDVRLAWWDKAKDDMRRLRGLIIEADSILEKREKIEASSAFEDFKNQLGALKKGGGKIKFRDLEVACKRAEIPDEEKELIYGFSGLDSRPKGGNETPFWKDKDEASVGRALAALKKVVKFKQTKVIAQSVEQKSVPASTPIAKEEASTRERTTIDKDKFLNACKEAFKSDRAVGGLFGEELRGRLRELVFESGTGSKRVFTQAFGSYLKKTLAKDVQNISSALSAFSRKFFDAKEDELYDDKIEELIGKDKFDLVKRSAAFNKRSKH